MILTVFPTPRLFSHLYNFNDYNSINILFSVLHLILIKYLSSNLFIMIYLSCTINGCIILWVSVCPCRSNRNRNIPCSNPTINVQTFWTLANLGKSWTATGKRRLELWKSKRLLSSWLHLSHIDIIHIDIGVWIKRSCKLSLNC